MDILPVLLFALLAHPTPELKQFWFLKHMTCLPEYTVYFLILDSNMFLKFEISTFLTSILILDYKLRECERPFLSFY